MNSEQLDLAVWPIFYTMEKRGIVVSFERLDALRADVEAQAEEQLLLAQEFSGVPTLNPSSSAEVAAWLRAEGLGGKHTSTGQLATDERSLRQHDHPAIDAILGYRGLRKMVSTFIDPVVEKAKLDEVVDTLCGIVHPRWRLTRVKSGRVSTEDPNLLAFPSRDEMGKKIRSCFVARPGHLFVSADYSQLEPRIVAALSRDVKLLDIYANDRDLYTSIAGELTVTRQAAKVLTLGILYGMGDTRLYEQLILAGCVEGFPPVPVYDTEACGQLIEKWFAAYPSVKTLVNSTVAAARFDRGWARTRGGRGRLLPGLFVTGSGWPAEKIRMEAERQAFNHLIQGTGMEMLKHAMLTIAMGLPEASPVLAIHDELIYEVPEDDAEKLADDIADSMRVDLDGVTLKVETAIADSWGGLK